MWVHSGFYRRESTADLRASLSGAAEPEAAVGSSRKVTGGALQLELFCNQGESQSVICAGSVYLCV